MTHGILHGICQALGLGPADLETKPPGAVAEPDPHTAEPAEAVVSPSELRRRMRESEAFRSLDTGATALYVTWPYQDGLMIVANETAGKMLVSLGEALRLARTYKMIFLLLFAR